MVSFSYLCYFQYRIVSPFTNSNILDQSNSIFRLPSTNTLGFIPIYISKISVDIIGKILQFFLCILHVLKGYTLYFILGIFIGLETMKSIGGNSLKGPVVPWTYKIIELFYNSIRVGHYRIFGKKKTNYADWT